MRLNGYLPHATRQADVEANSAKEDDGCCSDKRCYEELSLRHNPPPIAAVLLCLVYRHPPAGGQLPLIRPLSRSLAFPNAFGPPMEQRRGADTFALPLEVSTAGELDVF